MLELGSACKAEVEDGLVACGVVVGDCFLDDRLGHHILYTFQCVSCPLTLWLRAPEILFN